MVILKSGTHSFWVVISTSYQITFTHIANAFHFRTMEDEIIIEPTFGTKSAVHNTIKHHLIRHINQNNRIDIIAFKEEGSLIGISRKPIKNKTIIPIVLIKPLFNDFLHQFIRNKLTFYSKPLDTGSKLSMGLNMPAKNITHANMNQVKILGKHDRLRAFATTLHAGDNIFTHEYPYLNLQSRHY